MIIKCNIETEKLPSQIAPFDTVIFNKLLERLRINPIFTLSESVAGCSSQKPF